MKHQLISAVPVSFFFMTGRTRGDTLFPYTTLFRSLVAVAVFGMPVSLAGMSFLYGVGFGVLKIAWIVLASETDRKSTRLNSSHPSNSYAVFCLKIKICSNRQLELDSMHQTDSNQAQ